jgi:hypothetical protein
MKINWKQFKRLKRKMVKINTPKILAIGLMAFSYSTFSQEKSNNANLSISIHFVDDSDSEIALEIINFSKEQKCVFWYDYSPFLNIDDSISVDFIKICDSIFHYLKIDSVEFFPSFEKIEYCLSPKERVQHIFNIKSIKQTQYFGTECKNSYLFCRIRNNGTSLVSNKIEF